MIETVGNVFTYAVPGKSVLRCITTNGILKNNGELVMGAGIALAAKEKFPTLPRILGQLVRKNGNHVHIIEEYCIASFPTKHNWRDDSDLDLIDQSCREIVNLTSNWDLVVLPRVGTKNGNLNWADVKKVLEKHFKSDKYLVLVQ